MKKRNFVFRLVTILGMLSCMLTIYQQEVSADFIDNNGNVVREFNESEVNFLNEDFYPNEEAYSALENMMLRYPLSIRKINPKVTTEYSGFKRVSDDLKTGSAGGSISVNNSVSISGGTTGNVYGISVQSGKSTTSSVGYTLNVGPNKTAYVGYRAVYRVERGIREVYRTGSGIIETSNSYTAKLVTNGEYALIYK